MKMKYTYDRLLLALGGLALLVGCVFYAINFNKASTARAEIGQPGSNQYEPIPVPIFDENTVIWPNAEEQAPGELYDVFTPPAIWIDEEGTFIFESPIDDLPPMPFGVYLARLENELYRIQLEGYIEEDFDDPKKSVLLLYDEEKKERIRARVGQLIEAHEISVHNFTIDRIKDSNGVTKLAIVTILDLRDGRRIFLTHGQRKFKENTTVVLRSEEDRSFEIKISQDPPFEFRTATAKYVLEKINLEESSVTVKRLESGDIESETKKLFIQSNNKSKNLPNKLLEPKTNNGNQAFDFDF